ncbi:hypothetical protein LVO79_20640 (plasmid) [Roseivivax marinus]|uniref:hypothetical protein n=1 Tax=Roseivivax marinus TaxID=1379903 RepID=UPI001F047CD9|nr:hypothetical protein [Roseivivax marinus]UMA67218.1 hypothetical protein LVO79_20640 [Roseivivax marinus]
MPRSLDLSRLQQFERAGGEPRSEAPQEPKSERPVAEVPTERWPSREPVRDGQISIKAPLDVLARFRKLCKDDRRTYADMLSILMDAYERRD